MKTRYFGTAVVGLTGAIIGSFSMMLFASTHFTNAAGPNNTPPAVNAATLSTGGSDQDRIIAAVKRVEPSVVSLLVTVNGTRLVPADPFSQMFGGGGPSVRQRVQERASGSGFVYNRNGLIITNAHVVPAAPVRSPWSSPTAIACREAVFLESGCGSRAGEVDGYAKLPAPVEMADSSKLSAGQWAIAIGEPFELKQSVSLGIVSGFNRDEPIADERGQARLFRGMLRRPHRSTRQLRRSARRHRGPPDRREPSTAAPQSGAQGIVLRHPLQRRAHDHRRARAEPRRSTRTRPAPASATSASNSSR